MLASALAIVEARSALMSGGARGFAAQVASAVAVDDVAAGACMSFAPLAGPSDHAVFLDPGHGGPDPGVVAAVEGQQVLEKDVSLAVATRLQSMLVADGYRVVMSRVSDSSVARLGATDTIAGALTASAVHRDLVARTACANAAGSSVLLSIHFNAFDDPKVGGAETFYDPARPFSTESRRLATALQTAIVDALGNDDRGVWTDDQLAAPTLTPSGSVYGHLIELGPASAGWVDDPSSMPGALVEPLFLTNPMQARFAASPAGQEKIATALKNGLESYFGS